MLDGTRFEVVPSRLFQARTVVEAVDRRHRRAAAGGDDDRPRRGQDVVADDDPALAVEAAGAAKELDAPVFEPGQLARVVAVVDHLVAPRQRRLGVEAPGDRLLHARDPAGLGEQLAGAQQGLRGHARVVGAFAAEEPGLDDRDPEVAFGEAAGADLPGSPGAEDDCVEFPLSHQGTVQLRQT